MSWGASSTTQSNQQQNQSGNSASMPIEQPWVAALRSSFGAPIQSMIQQAGMPVFGNATRANFMKGVNDNTNNSTSTLASTLASRGALDSGAFAGGVGNIQAQRLSSLSDFNAQLPFQEKQAQQAAMQRALTTGFALTGQAPTGQVSSSSSAGTSSGTQTTQSNPGISSLVTGLLGAGLGMLGGGGMGGLFGSPSAGSGQAPAPIGFNDMYGANPGMFGVNPSAPSVTPWASTNTR